MANRSYLCLVDKRSLGFSRSEVAAMDAWAVPLLWLSLFRPADVLRDDEPDEEGEPGPRFAPVVAKETALQQLEDAIPYLNEVFESQGPLDEHAALFKKVFSRSKQPFVLIDLLEVAYTKDPQRYYEQLLAALTCLQEKQPPAVARKALLALTRLRLKKFPPTRCFLDDLKTTEDQDWNMARLFGTAWEKPVPWEPKVEEPEEPPLHRAVQKGDLAEARRLLRAGVNPNQKDWLDGTALQAAVQHGPAMVRLLLIEGANAQDDTALAWAASEGDFKVVQMLLERGADPTAKRPVGDDPALVCACQHAVKLVQLLLDAGADVNQGGGWTPLGAALMSENMDVARLLIKRGADVNARDSDGRTALHCAMIPQNKSVLPMVKLLLDAGANVNRSGLSTPLGLAAEWGLVDVARLLIARGANVNAKDREGNTPLVWAVDAEKHRLPMVKLLLEAGADVNKRVQRITPLRHAMNAKHKDVVALLRQHGAK